VHGDGSELFRTQRLNSVTAEAREREGRPNNR
jgi:hypothetical protein